MKEHFNSIIVDTNYTKEQVLLVNKWLEFEKINVLPICDKEGVQILSSNWEEEILATYIHG